MLYLPERQKYDRLDSEELQDWVERPEKIPGSKVKEKKGVEGDSDAGVVDEGSVQVALKQMQ